MLSENFFTTHAWGLGDYEYYLQRTQMFHQELICGFLHSVKLLMRTLPHSLHQNVCAVISKLPSFYFRKTCVLFFPIESWGSMARTYDVLGGVCGGTSSERMDQAV